MSRCLVGGMPFPPSSSPPGALHLLLYRQGLTSTSSPFRWSLERGDNRGPSPVRTGLNPRAKQTKPSGLTIPSPVGAWMAQGGGLAPPGLS